MEILCRAAGVYAYGAGNVSIIPKNGGGFVRSYSGGIVKLKAVISASGFEGKKALTESTDRAADKLMMFSGEGVIKVCSPYPAVIAEAAESGLARVERDIEIIYRGAMV